MYQKYVFINIYTSIICKYMYAYEYIYIYKFCGSSINELHTIISPGWNKLIFGVIALRIYHLLMGLFRNHVSLRQQSRRWLNQPIRKTLVKIGNLSQIGVKIPKNMWKHHLVLFIPRKPTGSILFPSFWLFRLPVSGKNAMENSHGQTNPTSLESRGLSYISGIKDCLLDRHGAFFFRFKKSSEKTWKIGWNDLIYIVLVGKVSGRPKTKDHNENQKWIQFFSTPSNKLTWTTKIISIVETSRILFKKPIHFLNGSSRGGFLNWIHPFFPLFLFAKTTRFSEGAINSIRLTYINDKKWRLSPLSIKVEPIPQKTNCYPMISHGLIKSLFVGVLFRDMLYMIYMIYTLCIRIYIYIYPKHCESLRSYLAFPPTRSNQLRPS